MKELLKIVEILAFLFAVRSVLGYITCVAFGPKAESLAEWMRLKARRPMHLRRFFVSLTIGIVIYIVIK